MENSKTICPDDGMVDMLDSKSGDLTVMRVQVPPSVPFPSDLLPGDTCPGGGIGIRVRLRGV